MRIARPPGDHSADKHKSHIRDRPHPGLLSARQVRFDQNRICEQSEHGARVGKRKETVGHRAAIRSRVPRLQERAGRCQQKIRQPHGSGQKPENAQQRVFDAVRFPGRVGQNRQREETQCEQRQMDDRLLPAGSARSPSARKHSRPATPSGRRACNWSRPRPTRRTRAGSAWRSAAAPETAETR